MNKKISRNLLLKITAIVGIWFLLTSLLYMGIIKIETVGHIEVALTFAFVIVILGIHLLKIILQELRNLERVIK